MTAPAQPKQKPEVSTRIITPEAILSYPHVFRPQAPPVEQGQAPQEPKYSATFVFLSGTDLSAAKRAVVAAASAKWTNWQEMVRAGQIRMPFRTDAKEKGYPEGSVFINCRSKQKPQIVSRFAGQDGKPLPITNEEEIYPGIIVRASVTAFAYATMGNKGVSFALNNIQKLADGERLDSRVAAADEFEAELSEQPASLEDLGL